MGRYLGWLVGLLALAMAASGCVYVEPAPAEMAAIEVDSDITALPELEATASPSPTVTPRPATPTPPRRVVAFTATSTPSATFSLSASPTPWATSTRVATSTPTPRLSSPTATSTLVPIVAPQRTSVVQQQGDGGPSPEEATASPTPTFTPVASPTPAPTCAGNETMTFVPFSPLVGSSVVISVTSSVPHVGVRLTGSPQPRFLGVTSSGGSFAWLWQVTPTNPGTHEFRFFIADSLLCATGSFIAAVPTPTPTPTPIPTPTPVPAPHIERLVPSHGAPGTAVTLHGKGFGDSQGNSVIVFDRSVSSGGVLQWGDYYIVLSSFPTRTRGRYEVQIIVRGMRSNVVYWTVD